MPLSPERRSLPIRYGTGALLALAAFALQSMLAIWVHGRVPFLLFIPTLALAAILFGRGPALIVFLAGLVFGAIALAPADGYSLDSPEDLIALGAYSVVGMFFLLLGGKVRTVARRAAAAEQVLFTERMQAQKTTQENDARFRIALDTSAAPFTILVPVKDGAGQVIDFRWAYLNAAAERVLGHAADRLIGRQVADILPGTWNEPGLFERFVAVSERGEAQSFELHSGATGIEGWFHVVASPLQESVVVWFADVTERKRQEQALRDADQRKDEFVAMLAHELRNPLAPIRQAAALAKLPGASEEQRAWSIEVIERQVRNMAVLLDDLLDVSRITRGMLTLRRTLIDVRSVLEAAIETARPVIEAKQHRLSVAMPPQAIHIEADELRVAQVVANLLNNAAKYTDPGGLIELAAESIADEVVISVTDSGIGIPPEKLPEIFGMFAQIKAEQDRSHGGLGIGLALSRGLVELHGGRIDAASDGPGKGSRFTVRLRLAAHKAAPDQTDAPATSPHARPVPRRVLIADDNHDAADTLAMLVEIEGHQVTVVYDGEAALEAFIHVRPDIALLDLGMPGLSGIEVAQGIRAGENGGRVVLVAITGWGQSGDRAKTHAAGFDHHLTKPVDVGRLRELLADGRPAEREQSGRQDPEPSDRK